MNQSKEFCSVQIHTQQTYSLYPSNRSHTLEKMAKRRGLFLSVTWVSTDVESLAKKAW